MDGLAIWRADANDFGEKIGGIDVAAWRRTRRAVAHDATTALGADHGQRRGRWMRATFGAAGNVDGAALRRHARCDLGGKRTRRDESRAASGFPRTSNDGTAWIIRAHDEAERLRGAAQRNRSWLGETKQQQRTARRRAHRPRAVAGGDAGELAEHFGMGVTKRK